MHGLTCCTCRLHELADSSVLPAQYGGTNPDHGESFWGELAKRFG